MKALIVISALLIGSSVAAQDCKTNADADAAPGKFLTADQYPWPAVRTAYFNGMINAADKALAKQTLTKLEKIEQSSHTGFNLTGGNWENYFSTDGYRYFGYRKLGSYTFQSSLHEFFCSKGKLIRNEETTTILRLVVNGIPINNLDRFISYPFGSSMGDYDFGLQYLDWKNHKPADVQAQLISLFSYISCNSQPLMEAINSGNNYFQDVPEKDIRPNNRNNYIYRCWFLKKKDLPVLVPVSRKEYLQSLLEYYQREKLYFPKLVETLAKDHDNGVKQYANWEKDVADKIAAVEKIISDHGNDDWLLAQAVINRLSDQSQTYKAKLPERTNYNRFWKFYDNESRSEPLYKYNPDYFKAEVSSPAKPALISVVFRYVSMPCSLRILNNFTRNFDFETVKKMLQ